MATPRRPLPPLFEPAPAPEVDARYAAWYRGIRDHDGKREARELLERIWTDHGHMLPEKPQKFLGEFREHFHPRAWELYMLAWLANTGATLERPPAKGPDFCATLPCIGRFWIECVVATIGIGENEVWQRPDDVNIWNGPPDEPLMLRYTTVIEAKIKKVAEYRAEGIVKPTEPVLLALNQGAIRDADLNDFTMPLAFQALYGFRGFSREELPNGEVREEVVRRPFIHNASGAEVSTQIFLEPRSSVVAGLLLTRLDIVNLLYSISEQPPVLLAHNPSAAVPVPHEVLPVRGEIWMREDSTLEHRGRVSSYGRFSRAPGEPDDLDDDDVDVE